MKTLAFFSVVFTLLVSCTIAEEATVVKKTQSEKTQLSVPEGFTPLFNGKDLTGWHVRPASLNPVKVAAMSKEEWEAKKSKLVQSMPKTWTVENEEIVNEGRGPYLTTDKEYENYELWIDYKTVSKADSGIYLKGTPQVQIWDYTDKKKFEIGADKGSGGLWNNSGAGKHPTVLADKPFGEWNRFRIIQVGAMTSVWLNDKQVVDHAILDSYFKKTHPLFRKGVIQLQTHGGQIKWRNIFIKEYSIDESNAYLAEAKEDEFKTIFNGKDLDGWKGKATYQVENGELISKGGTIFTEKEYSDFVVRFEFKLPPAGNNGLAIRYPGTGSPAYDGMCELQILDSEHKKYEKLDPRQYHGSAYGIAAAHRGYLREAGEWNFEEVTVQGSTIKVILNGNLILKTDLSKITEFKGGKKARYSGINRKKGHFGFAGHGRDQTAFRNIQIKELATPSKGSPKKPASKEAAPTSK